MMCALLLRPTPRARQPRGAAALRLFDRLLRFYERTLRWALRHGVLVMLMLAGHHRR